MLFLWCETESKNIFNRIYEKAQKQTIDEHHIQMSKIKAWRKELEDKQHQEKVDIVIEALEQYEQRRKQNENL
ncbi:hypothetical protein GKR09_05080 [Staphylococcus aureus]|nr:hypothetical protein [Staphylococcus aureus]